MRRFIVMGIVLLATGFIIGSLWLRFRPSSSSNDGEVRGATVVSSAFWHDAELLISGGAEPRLLVWRDGQVTPAPLPEALVPLGAAVSPDGRTLVLVAREGSQSVFWQYEEDRLPVPLTVTSGFVSGIRFSNEGRFLLFRERRDDSSVDELSLLDTQTRTLQRVTDRSIDALWVKAPHGIISTDDNGRVWFFGMQLSGRLDPPLFVAETRSDTAAVGTSSRLIFVVKGDAGMNLVLRDLATEEQRLLAPLNIPDVPNRITLALSPNDERVALMIPDAQEQENGSLMLVTTATGEAVALEAIAKHIRWVDETTLWFERVVAGVTQVWSMQPGERPNPVVAGETGASFAS